MSNCKQRFYLAVHKKTDVCKKSSSGGAFTAITDSWFQEHGKKAVVYGCVMDEQLIARHIRADNTTGRDAMRGSKYIGSDMSGIMRMVAGDIQNGYFVAFSGTPCQIVGLLSFLQAKGISKPEQLLTVEVICHGVASLSFFRDYLSSYKKKYKKRITACSFRGKKRPGKSAQMVLQFEDGTEYQSPSGKYDGFYAPYSRNYILRPSCYQCRYAQNNRFADITVGDHWEKQHRFLDSRSLIISNSVMGEEWVHRALAHMDCEELTAEQIHQPNMKAPSPKPDNYSLFWNVYREDGYKGAQRVLGLNTLKGAVCSMLVRVLYWLHIDEALKHIQLFIHKNGE